MKLKLKYTGYLVTIFLTIAFLSLLVMMSLLTIDRRYFTDKHTFYTRFNDATGLSASTPIIFKGFKIGRINDFYMEDDSRIYVTLFIYDEYKDLIKKNSVLKKTTNFLSGASSISYHVPEKSSELLPPESNIPSVDFDEGQNLAKEHDLEFSEELVYSLLSNLNTMLIDLNREYKDEKLLLSTVKKLNHLSDDLIKVSRNIVFLTNAVRNEVEDKDSDTRKVLTEIDNLADKLDNTAGVLTNVLLNADTLINNYKNPDSLLFKLLDPDGDEIINPMSKIIKGADTLLNEHTEFAKFLNTQQMQIQLILFKLNNTLNELDKSINGINNNPLIAPGIDTQEQVKPDRPRIK